MVLVTDVKYLSRSTWTKIKCLRVKKLPFLVLIKEVKLNFLQENDFELNIKNNTHHPYAF